MKQDNINDENNIVILPVLALKSMCIFPMTTVTFDVGRTSSLLAIEKAIEDNSQLLLVGQIDTVVEEPYVNDLYNIGTVCTVEEYVRFTENRIRVVVKGEYKVGIKTVKQDKPFLVVEAEIIKDKTEPNPTANLQAKRRLLIKKFNEYEKNIKNTGETNQFKNVYSIKNIDLFALEASNIIDIPYETKQQLLEAPGTAQRLELLLNVMHTETEIVRAMNNISGKVQDNFSKQQKDNYLREEMRVIKEELGEDEYSDIDEYNKKLLTGKYPAYVKERLEKDINKLEKMHPAMADSQVMRSYIEFALDLPWEEYTEDKYDITEAAKALNKDHYGMEKVKERILEFFAVRSFNKKGNDPILCLYGPPGVGKTSIARSIAECLGRKYVRISLGGVHDEAEIRGHRKTYVGAMAGRIITAIKQVGTSNPVILLDEIDKVANDMRGDPASALLEALDSEQNKTFRDNYLELPYDLSKVLFITTANSLDSISPILLDRMEVIEVSSYTEEEKFEIASRHLLPKQFTAHGLTKSKIHIDPEIIKIIINDYTTEAGVRELERTLAAVIRKSAKILAETNKKSIKITKELLVRMLGPSKRYNDFILENDEVGVATGLAWTSVGGITLSVEVNVLPGNGQIELTGRLGDVMKESAKAAISYIRSRAQYFNLDKDFYHHNDLHIHVPEGATPKDGPSAGITMATAMISALTGIPVKKGVAMTGEITVRGKILPIGGIKEKSLAALRNGIKVLLLPEENKKNENDLPDSVKNNMEIIYVKTMDDVIKIALTSDINKNIKGE